MNNAIVIIVFLSTTLIVINKVQAKVKPPETIKIQNTEAQEHNSTRSNKGQIKANNGNDDNQNGSTVIKSPVTLKVQSTDEKDHNSTRSNRGQIKANDGNNNNQNSSTVVKPQTKRKGRNPQTGKEINIPAVKNKKRNSKNDKK